MAYILTTTRRRVELDLLSEVPPAEVFTGPPMAAASLTLGAGGFGSVMAESSPIVRASRTFFDLGRAAGKTLAASDTAPPPATFVERDTGLVRTVYREVVMRFRPGTPERTRDRILARHNLQIRRVNPTIAEQVVVADADRKRFGSECVEMSNELMDLDEVVFATPNFVSQFRRQAGPAIPADQWHLDNLANVAGQVLGEDVSAREAWWVTRGKRTIVVAVLDDGVDIDHPNLRSRIWKNPDKSSLDRFGRDFFLPDDHPDHFNPRPKTFQAPFDQLAGNDIHGTPCAGVIAAAGHGAFGIAFGCKVLAIKIFHADAFAADERVADAIRYAASRADVLSCSWSGGSSPDIELAIEDAGAIGRGGLGSAVFCAAGNDQGAPVGFPASHPQAIAVGASTDGAARASYSNVGPEIDLVAPSSGGTRGIYTTDVSMPGRGFNVGRDDLGGADGRHTNAFGGTSSATPLAAGVAALVLSLRPSLNREALRDLLCRTADKIGSGYDPATGHSPELGHGRVNAARAVAAAKQ